MKKKIDVTALGEILIDFTFAGKSAFIGMTGEDSFDNDLRARFSVNKL